MKNLKAEKEVYRISVGKWIEIKKMFAADLCPIPLCFYVTGNSMFPLIRNRIDKVTVYPLKDKIKRSDIVLFETGCGNYMLHRVYRIKENMVLTYGDGNLKPDIWIDKSRVLGIAQKIERGSWTIFPQSFFGRNAGRLWMGLSIYRPYFFRMMSYIGMYKHLDRGDS